MLAPLVLVLCVRNVRVMYGCKHGAAISSRFLSGHIRIIDARQESHELTSETMPKLRAITIINHLQFTTRLTELNCYMLSHNGVAIKIQMKATATTIVPISFQDSVH